MGKQRELSEHLDVIFKILNVAKENFEYAHYLYEPMSLDERDYLKVDRNLQFIRLTLLQMAIIEIDKLINKPDSHKYNLFSLLSKLKPNGYYNHFKVDEFHLAIWEGSLLSQHEAIGKINILRDKYFAHTDPLTKEVESPVFELIEMRELLHILVQVFNSIASATIEKQFIFTDYYFHRADFDMVKILAAAYYKELDELEKLIDRTRE